MTTRGGATASTRASGCRRRGTRVAPIENLAARLHTAVYDSHRPQRATSKLGFLRDVTCLLNTATSIPHSTPFCPLARAEEPCLSRDHFFIFRSGAARARASRLAPRASLVCLVSRSYAFPSSPLVCGRQRPRGVRACTRLGRTGSPPRWGWRTCDLCVTDAWCAGASHPRPP